MSEFRVEFHYEKLEPHLPSQLHRALPGCFNESDYLEANQDVSAAVMVGTLESGAAHWIMCGIRERRSIAGRPMLAQTDVVAHAMFDDGVVGATGVWR